MYSTKAYFAKMENALLCFFILTIKCDNVRVNLVKMSLVNNGSVSFYPHLLYIVIQRYNGQRCRQADTSRYGGSHWRCLADVAMVTGLQEVGCLVVLIQNFDLEVGKSWQGVTVVLLCLKGVREK